MQSRQAFHIGIRLVNDQPQLTEQLNRAANSPQWSLTFCPSHDSDHFPVTVYWKSPIPSDADLRIKIERAILAYCARLHEEEIYEGPINCCL